MDSAAQVKQEPLEPEAMDTSSEEMPSSVESDMTSPVSPDPQSPGYEDFESAGFTLANLLKEIDSYKTTIPDSVTSHLLHTSGFETSDPRVSKLISIAAQKFTTDILNDAFTHCKLRTAAPIGGKTKSKDKKYVLTMEDLVPVLSDYGVTVKKPPYFV